MSWLDSVNREARSYERFMSRITVCFAEVQKRAYTKQIAKKNNNIK